MYTSSGISNVQLVTYLHTIAPGGLPLTTVDECEGIYPLYHPGKTNTSPLILQYERTYNHELTFEIPEQAKVKDALRHAGTLALHAEKMRNHKRRVPK